MFQVLFKICNRAITAS